MRLFKMVYQLSFAGEDLQQYLQIVLKNIQKEVWLYVINHANKDWIKKKMFQVGNLIKEFLLRKILLMYVMKHALLVIQIVMYLDI